MQEFRALLQSRLQRRGDLARLIEASGIAGPVIIRWRDGNHRPSTDSLRRLAEPLGVPYEELLRMCGYLPGVQSEAPVDPELREVVSLWPRIAEWQRQAIKQLVRTNVQSGRFHAPVAA